jgi:hypothetical protein
MSVCPLHPPISNLSDWLAEGWVSERHCGARSDILPRGWF